MREHRYCEYRRTPLAWLRRWWRQRTRIVDRSDGRDYTGWTVLVRGVHDGLPPARTWGRVVGADRQCGELAHRIEFPGVTVTVPLPWPGIELIESAQVTDGTSR